MKVSELAEKLNLKVLSGEAGLEREVTECYVSDLLSDVMDFSDEGHVWVTLQTHKNIMAIASLKEMAAIILVKGLKPEKDTIEKSNSEEIAILGTDEETFDITGKLYNLLNV